MKQIIRLAAMMWHTEKRWLLIGLFASFLATGSAIALLALSGWFITAAGLAGIGGAGLLFDFFRPSAGIRFLALLRTGSRYAERIATHDATLRFLTALRTDLFRQVAVGPARSLRSSELLQRLTGDLDVVDSLYLRVLLPSAVAATVLVLSFAILLPVLPATALAIGIAFALAAIVLAAGARLSQKPARRTAIGNEALRVRSIDLVHAQTDLHFSRGISAQKLKIGNAAQYLSNATLRLANIEIAVSTLLAAISAALTAAIVYLCARAIQFGEIDGPVLVMLVIGGFAALEVFAPLRRGALEIGRVAFSGKRLELLEATPNTVNAPDFAVQSPAVSVQNLTFRHGNNEPILKHFTLEVSEGERVALVGRSGSGKSTLLSLIAGLLEPSTGSISLRRSADEQPTLGYLTQQTELFHGSIADNLRIASPNASDPALWQALEIVELDQKVRGLEAGLDWHLGEGASGFSGGEARRLALARLVLRDPAIWLLDEPTAGMDQALGVRVMGNLMRHAPDATWIIAAHHDRETAHTNRAVAFDRTTSA